MAPGVQQSLLHPSRAFRLMHQPTTSNRVQKWKKDPLAEKWEGPYQVLLTTHTAVRLSNSDKWTHYSRVKPFHPEDTNSQGVVTPEADNTREQEADKWTSEPVGDLKLRLHKCGL
ncbi:uncharacterized protein LOC132244600 isoform X4 [Alligator mississippiensis]|uniref:uncharacterized protein LOC132244600 isoform X4 n=1 Tax=Alligator mississippiensis TaxID=8496 RepID=UPI002877EA47|nr:uncharacterized protein LOC132244600 isoform X4 [Alligator mississippiensis]